MTSVLAVDLGGTKTALAAVREDGTVTQHRKIPAHRSPDDAAACIASAAKSLGPVGVIVPGIYNSTEGTAWCPNLFGMAEVPLLSLLRAEIGAHSIAIDSDRTGCVLGEAWLGVARGLRHVVFVAIGTGIGIGILSDGHVIRGSHGIAGAAGWWSLTPEWRDIYEATGCWESEGAGPAVARAAKAASAETVVHAARAGDAEAHSILHRAAEFTGRGVANLISIFDPEMVVLGGGLFHGAGDLLLQTVRHTAHRWAQPVSVRKCRIELSTLGENAGLLGAARLALDLT